jgi:hypothetical protein
MRILAICVLAIALTGCAAHKNHPGAANAFDSDSYDTLLVTDTVIQSTKADLTAGTVPAAISAQVKTALNVLIEAYDIADASYIVYHTAAVAGTATAAQQAAVTNSLSAVTTAAAQLATARGKK